MAVSQPPLSRRAEQAISALLTTASIGDAAQQAGIGERTLYRWLREDAPFQAAYRRAKRQVVEQAMTQIQQATGIAVETLLAVMQDPETPASARVSAAKAVLEQALKTVEIEDLESRLTALEAQIKETRR